MLGNPATWLFVAIAPLGIYLAVRFWRPALFSVFVLLIIEGALRKWVLPGAQAQLYFLKDVVLLGAYIGLLLDRRRPRPPLRGGGAIKIILIVALVFGCLEVFNPYSPSILVGLIGVKTYFLYAPLAFVLPYAFKSREQLFYVVRCYILIAIPIAALGFFQSAAGPDSFINTYVSHTEEAAVVTRFGAEYDLVRTSGTFSYISGYTAYLTFMAFLALGYNMAQRWQIRNNALPLAALTLVVGAMFTTGSRAPVFTLIAMSPAILGMAVATRVLAPVTAVRLCIVLPFLAIAALSLSPEAFEAFVHRANEASDSTYGRLLSPALETIEALSKTPVLGVGIGTTHPSALAVMGTDWPWWLEGLLTEVEMARVTVELGLPGLILIFGLRLFVATFALRCIWSLKHPAHRALGIPLAVYLGLGIINSIMLNVTAGVYYWGALGLLLAMRRLEQATRVEAKAVAAPLRRTLRPAAVHISGT